MTENKCPSCGATINANATECKYCGETISVSPQYQGQPVGQIPPQYQGQQMGQVPPQYGAPQVQQIFVQQPVSPTKTKNKVVAGLLAIFLGAFGIHKFYLGKIGMGILYLIFCWTYIPGFIGFIEGIIYLASSPEKFNAKYSK